MMGRIQEQVADIPAGNTCGLVGIDQYLLKSGTITTLEDAVLHQDDEVLGLARRARARSSREGSKDLPKLVEGLKRLSKSDPMVLCYMEDTGEHVIAGCGELHLEICLKDLQEDFMGCEVEIGPHRVLPRVLLREVVSQVCLSKSRTSTTASTSSRSPRRRVLCGHRIVQDRRPAATPSLAARYMADTHGWDVTEARKIWAFGPMTDGAERVHGPDQGR